MTKEWAVPKGGSSNLLEEITKLMVGLIIDEFVLTSMEERNFCSVQITAVQQFIVNTYTNAQEDTSFLKKYETVKKEM